MAKNNSYVTWTEQDEKTLRRVYPAGGLYVAAKALPNRSLNSIRHKVNKMKLSRINGLGSGEFASDRNPWTLEEEQIMRDHYVLDGLPTVSALMPLRTLSSIRCKANSMGLQRRLVQNKLKRQEPIEELNEKFQEDQVVIWVKAENAARPVTTAPRSIFEMATA